MSRSAVAVLAVVVASFMLCVSCAKKEPAETAAPAGEQTAQAEGAQTLEKSQDTGDAYAAYLTPEDVSAATDRAGVKRMEKNVSMGAGGDLNFGTADDKVMLMVQVVDKKFFSQFKAYHRRDVGGVGDAAFTGATLRGYDENLVVFSKGERCVALTAFPDPQGEGQALFVAIDRMIALAKVVASRM
jgi:hypothetical protein